MKITLISPELLPFAFERPPSPDWESGFEPFIHVHRCKLVPLGKIQLPGSRIMSHDVQPDNAAAQLLPFRFQQRECRSPIPFA